MKAIIETSKGTLEAELYIKETPINAGNFAQLAKKGFYDGLTFHRVIPGFVVQGGCPEGTGAGGPGYTINCETNADKQFHDRGVLSMAHRGPNTGGSQFFIVLSRQQTAHLDRKHTCFGKITGGIELIDDLRMGDKIIKISIED